MFLEAVLSGLSILIAGIIAIIRFKKIDRAYYPFLIFIWLGSINEMLSFLLVEMGYYTAINNNIYSLLEAISLSVFFRNIGTFKKIPAFFNLLIIITLALWVWENFIYSKIIYVSSWFMIFYSFCLVLMSISTINKLIIQDINKPIEINSRHILKNPVLLICIGSTVFYTFAILVEVFWLYGLGTGKIFRLKIYEILVYINVAANLIYALAVLCIPPKQIYTSLY